MDPRINGYERGLASMVYKFFDERTKGSGLKYDKKLNENKKLAEELHKTIIKNFKRRKVYSSFILVADMSLISNFNKGIRYLLCVIDF